MSHKHVVTDHLKGVTVAYGIDSIFTKLHRTNQTVCKHMLFKGNQYFLDAKLASDD